MKITMPNVPREPLIFSAGVAVGALVMWLSVKKVYADRADAEIESVKEVYARINAAKNKPDISTYTQSVMGESAEQTTVEEAPKEETEQAPTVTSIPYDNLPDEEDYQEEPVIEKYIYEIDRSEFASYDNDNTRTTMYYFTDNVYTDEMYDRLDPRDYFRKKLVLLGGGEPVDLMDYIHRMKQDEICIRDTELGLDIDLVTQGLSFAKYMST